MNIDLISLLYKIPGLLLAFSIHEYFHALVAYKCGDHSQVSLGRLTMNPVKHVDPLGFILVLMFNFGWAKPVQVNTRYFKHPRRDDFLVSVAGPISNFLLAFILSMVYLLMFNFGQELYDTIKSYQVAADMILHTVFINLVLAIFNMLPLPGLDGYRAITALLPYKIRERLYFLERYSIVIFMIIILTGAPGSILNIAIFEIFNFFINIFNLIAGIFI